MICIHLTCIGYIHFKREYMHEMIILRGGIHFQSGDQQSWIAATHSIGCYGQTGSLLGHIEKSH